MYLASADAERMAEAEKYLQMARKCGPEWGWQSVEELNDCMDKLKLTGNLFGLPNQVLDKIARKIINLNRLCWQKNRLPDKGGVIFDVYALENSGTLCRHIKIWTSYIYSLRKISKGSVRVNSIPISAFFNENGDIIKCDFSDTGAKYGRYTGVLTYGEVLKRNRLEFLATELEVPDCLSSDASGGMLLNIENVNVNWGAYGCMILVPKDTTLESVSLQPDEIIEMENAKILVYTRFLYAFQPFRLKIAIGKNSF
jgi:hypothetical protein